MIFLASKLKEICSHFFKKKELKNVKKQILNLFFVFVFVFLKNLLKDDSNVSSKSVSRQCLKLPGYFWISDKKFCQNYMILSNFIQLLIKNYRYLEIVLKRCKDRDIFSVSWEIEKLGKNLLFQSWGPSWVLERIRPTSLKICATLCHKGTQ